MDLQYKTVSAQANKSPKETCIWDQDPNVLYTMYTVDQTVTCALWHFLLLQYYNAHRVAMPSKQTGGQLP
jgi:hypothetical protein